MLTYGSAVGEIVIDDSENRIAGLWNGDISKIRVSSGKDPFARVYTVKNHDNSEKTVSHPERILYASLIGGHSLLRGLPALSSILMRIFECVGQNFDRAGNVRYAITYKPSSDSGDMVYSRERAQQIAREWADGMNSARCGQVKDFVAVGDVDIKVIGAKISSLIPMFLFVRFWNSLLQSFQFRRFCSVLAGAVRKECRLSRRIFLLLSWSISAVCLLLL